MYIYIYIYIFIHTCTYNMYMYIYIYAPTCLSNSITFTRVSHSPSLLEEHVAETMILTIKIYVFQMFPHTNCSATLSRTMDHFIILIGAFKPQPKANINVSGKHFLSLDIYMDIELYINHARISSS